MQKELKKWLNKVLKPYIKDAIHGINFNLYENEENQWTIEMVGTASFDENNPDWVCDEVFSTRDNPFTWREAATREEIQEKVKVILLEYVNTGKNSQRLRNRRGVGVGFVNSDIEIVYKMCSYDCFIQDVCAREDVENGDYSALSEVQKMAVMCFWYDATVNCDGHDSYFSSYSHIGKEELANALKVIADEEILNNFLMAANSDDEEVWEKADDRHYAFDPQLNEYLQKFVEEHKDEIFDCGTGLEKR